MNEFEIKTHDFENAKKELKEFSEQTVTDFDLKRVDTSKGAFEWIGGFLLGEGVATDHKVTGYELNELTSQVQNHFIDINSTQRKLIQEFGQVYNALEALDKDYIQGIVISIEAAKITSEGVAEAQKRIEKIVEDQKKTLEVLKKFKQKLDNYAHLGDVDKMWSDCQEWLEDITRLADLIDSVAAIGSTNEKDIKALKTDLESIDGKITDLRGCLDQQIAQIEAMVEKGESTLELVYANQNRIDGLMKFKEEFGGIVKLNEKNVEVLENELKTANGEIGDLKEEQNLRKAQIESLTQKSEEAKNMIHNNKKVIDADIAEVAEKSNTAVQMLTKKIKYLYVLVGGTLGLALIEMLVIIMKVL